MKRKLPEKTLSSFVMQGTRLKIGLFRKFPCFTASTKTAHHCIDGTFIVLISFTGQQKHKKREQPQIVFLQHVVFGVNAAFKVFVLELFHATIFVGELWLLQVVLGR